MDSSVVFGHERLVAWQRAREASVCVAQILATMPRGEQALADQLRRASDSVLLNIAEGAARTSGPDQAKFYDIARGSAGEAAAALSLCAIRNLASDDAIGRGRRLLHEVVRMLTALARVARS